MRFAAALSGADRFDTAFDEVLDDLEAQLDGARPDLLTLFVGSAHHSDYVRLHRMLREVHPAATVIGCSAGGTLAAGQELEEGAGLAIGAAHLPGVEARAFHIEPGRVPVPEASGLWRDTLGTSPGASPTILLLPEPFTSPVAAVLEGIDRTFEGSTVFGGLASGMQEAGEGALFAGDDVHGAGTAGVVLTGDLQVDTIVSQGCRPIGSPMFVTRGHENLITGLDGQSPTTVLQRLYDTLPSEDQARLRQSLFVGVVMNDDLEVYEQGDFLIRNIVGLDGDSGALAIGADVRPNTVVQFHLRDAETSAQELQSLLEARHDADTPTPAGALMFSCLGRGRSLYGKPNFDSSIVHGIYPDLPLAGFFCNGEIGPVQGIPYQHGYTNVLALFS
jgi:small ligand-binding sensory domain FIST